MKTLYMIGGAMGAGKTTCGRALKNILENSVFLDADNLWDMHPFTVSEHTEKCVISNICACLNNFLRCPQFDSVIFCWVMHLEGIRRDILSRLNLRGVRVVNVLLACSPQTLAARIRSDVGRGVRSPGAEERALGYLSLCEGQDLRKICTDGLSPEEVAKILSEL